MPSSAPPSSLRNLHFSLASVTKDQMRFLVQKKYNADTAASDRAGWERSKNLPQTQGTATSRARHKQILPYPPCEEHAHTVTVQIQTVFPAILQLPCQQWWRSSGTASSRTWLLRLLLPATLAAARFRPHTPRFCTRDFQCSHSLLHYRGFAGSRCLPFYCRPMLFVD